MSVQIHKHLPPLLHLESCHWNPTTSWHVIYTWPYLPICVKYESNFWDRMTKHMSKDKRKMHHWCLCRCWLFLGAITWNLIAFGFHSIPTFTATHSKFTQFTFHFYKCFCKSRHAKESIVKRVSKGQRATTSMKSVKVLFEHCCCLAFFFKRFIFTS